MNPYKTQAPRRGSRKHRSLLCVALAAVFPASAAPDLTKLSLEQLMDIKVVGASKYEQKQSEVAAAVSIITRDEIRAFGWRTLDEAVASLPGVYTTYDRRYVTLGTRGLGLPGDYNMRVLVTINGNRVNAPTYDSGPFGRLFQLDMDLVERIEFIPGPGGAVYGQNAMFGVVNVVTRDGADVDGTELALTYQHPESMREGRASWGKAFDNGVDVLVSVSGMRARGEDRFYDFGVHPVTRAAHSGVAVGLDGDHDNELFARVAGGPWSFDLVHADRRKDAPTAAYFSDPLVPGQYEADRYALAQLQYQESYADDTVHVAGRLFIGRDRFRAKFSFVRLGGPVTVLSPSDWRGAEVRLLSTGLKDHKLMLGLEIQDNVRYDQSLLLSANPAASIVIPGSGYRAGLYVQDEWRIVDSLTATMGLRLDRNNVTGNKHSPRAALIWQAAPATTLKALFGRAHRAPNAFERDYDTFAQAGNPELKGESIDTLEFVADHRVGSNLTLRGALYQWSIRDLVTLGIEPASGKLQYQSGDKVKARGVELSADKTWARGVRLRGSVSVQDVSQVSDGGLLNSPKWLGKLNLSAPLPVAGLRAGYELRYDSKRLSLDGSELDGYALSNLYLSSDALANGLELSLGIYNLFDTRYEYPGSHNHWQNALEQDGRSVRVKLVYKF